MNEQKYYTGNQLAVTFGVDRHTITNWRRTGKLSYVKIGGRYFYPKDQNSLKEKTGQD